MVGRFGLKNMAVQQNFVRRMVALHNEASGYSGRPMAITSP